MTKETACESEWDRYAMPSDSGARRDGLMAGLGADTPLQDLPVAGGHI